LHFDFICVSIVLKPDPARQVDPGLGAGTGLVEEKIEEGKTRCDPVKNPVETC
jgi:hypothetical protein